VTFAHRTVLGLAVSVLVLTSATGIQAATAAVPAAVPIAAATSASAPTLETVIQTILADTNALRAKKGLKALKRNTAMDSVALAWSQKQANANTMAHNPNYSKEIPSGWSFAAENVAYGYDYTEVVAAWKASAGHYKNILSDATHIGIGFATVDGVPYFTQNFAKYPSSAHFFSTVPKPKVTGTATVHQYLRATPGTWVPSGVKFTYRWYASGKLIPGQTKSTMKISKKYKGKQISVRVTGKKSGYTSITKSSKSTSKVRSK
jgi:uncharacterized protein YkwD